MAGKKADVQSEVYEGEMNAMAVVHRDSKLIVGNRVVFFNFYHTNSNIKAHIHPQNSTNFFDCILNFLNVLKYSDL